MYTRWHDLKTSGYRNLLLNSNNLAKNQQKAEFWDSLENLVIDIQIKAVLANDLPSRSI